MLLTGALEPSPLAWAVLYLVLRTTWAVALARVAVRDGATAAWVWSAAAADACASVLVLAWWYPAMRPMLGALVLPLFLYLLFFETVAVAVRFRDITESGDEAFTQASLVGGLLRTPALVAWEIWGVAPPLLAGAALSFMV
jgi:hypothetical protein